MSVISVKNLIKNYKVYKKEPGFFGAVKSLYSRNYELIPAVSGISFEIEKGELVGFIGPNGAGKTTTLKCLSGLLYPSSGKVEVLGFNPWKRENAFLKQISLVMGQKNQLWWDLPPMESFLLYKEIYELADADFKKTVGDLADLMDLHDILHVQVRKLSLGQRMKCELAAQLLHKPKILFLDEPTIGLDVVVQQKMREFVRQYNKEFQATILLTSHYMDDVKELCKRIIIINHGKVLYDGLLADIVERHTQKKQIVVVFEREVVQAALAKLGTVIAYDPTSCTIEVPREQVASVVSHILSQYSVVDLSITEPEIEEVISTIFSTSQA